MGLKKGRWFGGQSDRGKKRTANLGIIPIGGGNNVGNLPVRKKALELLDQYYEGSQYDNLMPWSMAACQDEYVPIKGRQPLIKYNLPKLAASRIAGKLIGSSVFPTFKVDDDPDTEEFIRMIVKVSKLQLNLLSAFRRMAVSGSVLVRFFMDNGAIRIEKYLSKWCYPEFLPTGDLKSVRIQYVYEDPKDLDESGNPRMKWFRLDLGQFVDTRFDNPEYQPSDEEPAFQIVSQVQHNLGFVQAEWFRTNEDQFTPDGVSLIGDAVDFFDDMNYSLSQSSQATSYNQDPQLTVSGLDSEEVNSLIKSSQKGWNLGREGKASFIESDLGAVSRAMELRDKARLCIQDVIRVALLDPEKVVGYAQSAKAMEVLHGPMLELIYELRPQVEDRITALVTKMMITTLIISSSGGPTAVQIPQGYRPKSLGIEVNWPPVFQQTTQDLTDKVRMVTSATSANLISRETGLRYLAKDFNIENIEEEIAKIAEQPVFNPFGAF